VICDTFEEENQDVHLELYLPTPAKSTNTDS